MRKTKIVCTLGPASETEEIIIALCKAGMNVARLNFSHNTHADHQRRIDTVKKVRQDLNMPIAIMLDTKGPEYRIKTFKNGKVLLQEGQEFTFTTDNVDELIEKVRAEGYKVTVEPQDVNIPTPEGFPVRIAFCIGAAGEEVEFFTER